MRNPALVFVVTLAFLHFSCATNKARVITPNEEEVQVLDGTTPIPMDLDEDGKPEGVTDFVRGKTALDEQEFYEAIGDKESYDTVKGSRGAGFALQGVGLAGLLLGLAGAGGGLATYLLSDASDGKVPQIPIDPNYRTFVLYGVYGAAALAVLGGVLFFAMAGKARGAHRIYPLEYARQRLEVSLYGANGATPDDIKTLRFAAVDNRTTICPGEAISLTPLEALDARGRHMKVSDRVDWFQWLTTPTPGLVTQVPDAPVLSSSLGRDYRHLDTDIGVSIKVAQTGVGHELRFGHEFRCSGFVQRQGEDGAPGERGDPGKSGHSASSSRMAQPGAQGQEGADGADGAKGPDLAAEVAWVTTAKYGRLALLVVDGEGHLFDPASGRKQVIVSGGAGGRGGDGGRGGSGGDGQSHTCVPGVAGGQGGKAGKGGNGGAGGTLVIRTSDPALLNAVQGVAAGGRAGAAGSPGEGGSGGRSGSCRGSTPNPKSGAPGHRGVTNHDGRSGQPGTVRTEVVAVDQLARLREFVEANPMLTLEAGATSVVPAKKRK